MIDYGSVYVPVSEEMLSFDDTETYLRETADQVALDRRGMILPGPPELIEITGWLILKYPAWRYL